jgi:hypothetical protein
MNCGVSGIFVQNVRITLLREVQNTVEIAGLS